MFYLWIPAVLNYIYYWDITIHFTVIWSLFTRELKIWREICGFVFLKCYPLLEIKNKMYQRGTLNWSAIFFYSFVYIFYFLRERSLRVVLYTAILSGRDFITLAMDLDRYISWKSRRIDKFNDDFSELSRQFSDYVLLRPEIGGVDCRCFCRDEK